MEVNKLKYQAA